MKAFPCSVEQRENDRAGMDLRDHFAAKAMQTVLSSRWWSSELLDPDSNCTADSQKILLQEMSAFSYEIADAMMAARNNNKE